MFTLDLTWDFPAKHITSNEPSEHILRIRLAPQPTPLGLPLHLAVALDTSSSMFGEKLQAAKQALHLIVSQLRPQDRFSLCSFNHQINPLLTNVSYNNSAISPTIDHLQAIGTTRTDLALAWLQQVFLSNTNVTDIAQVAILITDGHATNRKGMALKAPAEIFPLLDQAKTLAAHQITLCAVGLGNAAQFNVSFLTSLSDCGKGAFLYADTPTRLQSDLQRQLQAAQAIATSEATLKLTHLLDGVVTTGYCRYRPTYIPLEEIHPGILSLGALPGDQPTDILLSLWIPAPNSLSARSDPFSQPILSLELQANPLFSPITQTASLNYTRNYRESTQSHAEVDHDRRGWENNVIQTEVQTGEVGPERMHELLSNLLINGMKTGDTGMVERTQRQLADLTEKGQLDPHKTAEITRDYRHPQRN